MQEQCGYVLKSLLISCLLPLNSCLMKIGLDGSRAFLKKRTGIEEYSYQVIRHLRDELKDARVIVYIRADQDVDFALPEQWTVKKLWAPRLWTQGRLSLQMLVDRPDVLFVPAHTVPLMHPKKTVVVVHGLEYEFCPEAYSWWERVYMRLSIWFSCKVADRVICVSENTKRDVVKLYGVLEEKISVIHEACSPKIYEKHSESLPYGDETVPVSGAVHQASEYSFLQPYFLFIGRLEERKNVVRMIEAFEIFKEKYNLSHKLVLAGKPGYGYEKIVKRKAQSEKEEDIVELGYVNEEEKEELLRGAEGFLFPTLYEGFGLPVLEAQAAHIPVIASNVSSLPEVAGEGAVLVNPESVEEIVEAMYRVVSDEGLKHAILQKGKENLRRFSWEKCARELVGLFTN